MLEIANIKDNVDHIRLKDGKDLYLVGTAHVSKSSVELAEEVIKEISPDCVAVELCQSRFDSLKDPERWKKMDVVSVIRKGRAYVLLAQLMLAGYQKKLGNQLQIKPGAEMIRSVEIAEESNIETVLADRDIRTTMKRTWASLGFWGTLKLVFGMIGGVFSSPEIDEAEIERLKSADALDELMAEFTKALPGVRESLIDERDRYLAAKIREAPGSSIVAIVGAGHVPGIKEWIGKEIDLEALDVIPPSGKIGKIIGWAIPILVIGLIIWGFFNAGSETSFQMVEAWFWINGIFGAVGATLALGHPITILVAFISSPFTSLNPFIAGGWVAGICEAMIRKPRVEDLEAVADDVTSIRGVWKNRVTRILLVVVLTNLFGSIGTFVGIGEIVSILN